MKTNDTLDKVSDVLMCLGVLGLAYKALTNQISSRLINKIITTYNTSRMWGGWF